MCGNSAGVYLSLSYECKCSVVVLVHVLLVVKLFVVVVVYSTGSNRSSFLQKMLLSGGSVAVGFFIWC